MKKILVIIALLYSISALSQDHRYPCKSITVYDWNDEKNKYDFNNSFENESVFVINKAMTVLEHYHKNGTTKYFVKVVSTDNQDLVQFRGVTSNGDTAMIYFKMDLREIRIAIEVGDGLMLFVYKMK